MTFTWLHSRPWFKDYIQNQHLKLFKDQFMLLTFMKYLPAPPEYRGIVGGKMLFEQLDLGSNYKRNDKDYQYTTVSEMERFLQWYSDPKQPIPDFDDCDDSALRCDGMIKFWSSGLAGGVFDLIEPRHQRNWAFLLPDIFVGTNYTWRDCKYYQFEPRGTLFPMDIDNIRWMRG